MNKYFDDKDDIRLIILVPHSIGMALMLLSRGTIVYPYAADKMQISNYIPPLVIQVKK